MAQPLTLGQRLQKQANAAFNGTANQAEYVLYIAGLVVDTFCKSLRDANLVKKFATAICLSADWLRHFNAPVGPVLDTATKGMSAARGVLGAVEAFVKWDNVVTPLRERGVVLPQGAQATALNPDNSLQSGDQAPEADTWEVVAKKVSQVSDWAFGLCDFVSWGLQTGVISVAKETLPTVKYGMGVVQVIAGFSMSGFGIFEESVKLTTGNIVRESDGFVWKATPEDEIQSWIKMAMNISYFVLAVYGLASLAGVLLPAAATVKLVCATVATVTSLANYFWSRIAIDSLERHRQPRIQS